MSTSPVSNLDNDTLLTVFDLITSRLPQWSDTEADSQRHRPLTIVRISSQVCQRWRALLLASTWIWGRVMDLDAVSGPRRVEWLEQVYRRAGTAALWIHGRVQKPTATSHWADGTQSFFVRLLGSWERIEKLSAIIESDDEKIISDIQNFFLSRAPVLEHFSIFFSSVHDSIFLDTLQPGSSRPLFADHAPLLRTINASQVAFKQDSPWLANIREIVSFPKHLTLSDIFVVLQNARRVQKIALCESPFFPRQMSPASTTIALPDLSSIKLWTSLSVLARILDQISPGKISSFHMITRDWGENDPYDLSSLKENLPRYISSYFSSNPSTAIILWITHKVFRLSDLSNKIVDENGQIFKFEVAVRTYERARHWDTTVSSLLDAFTAATAGSVSIFKSITRMNLPLIGVKPAMILKLYSMLAGFSHLQYLVTNERCGETLVALSALDKGDDDPQQVLFPSLHTLRLTSVNTASNYDHKDLSLFIKRRKSIGFPIAKLDLTSCNLSNYAQHLRDLEEVHGLEVVWKKQGDGSGEADEICSYICGTGDLEQLKDVLR